MSLPRLFQTTAFGLTGLVTIDMLSKLDGPKKDIELIFLDTLHHFSETHALVERVRQRYGTKVHVYKPQGIETAAEFAKKHGDKLWEANDQLYDWLAKVEPAQRAYRELQVNAVLTGRRRSQGAQRGDLDIIEIDEAGLIKVNPLANWSFQQVKKYVDTHNVPYNELLDRGYKSVGDWHSTQPVKEGEDERAGRWKGQAKTECGIHNPRSKYAMFLQEQALKQALQTVEVKVQDDAVVQTTTNTETVETVKTEVLVPEQQEASSVESSEPSQAVEIKVQKETVTETMTIEATEPTKEAEPTEPQHNGLSHIYFHTQAVEV